MPAATESHDKSHAAIDSFAAKYGYDMSYQRELIAAAPESFAVFERAQLLSGQRRRLPLDAHYVARVSMMLADDCGDCIQLNLRMAVEAGVDRGLLLQLLDRPQDLPAPLRDVRDHAFDVAMHPVPDPQRTARLRSAYGDGGFAELSMCLAGCQLFTTVKRSLGKARPFAVARGDF